MKRSTWLTGIQRSLGKGPRRKKTASRRALTPRNRLAVFENLEDRCVLAVDFGDAPDAALGTGMGNYQTLATDNGAQHTIVVGLKLGANVDGDGGALQNAAANADDVNGALPDDEDGLANPMADLVLTVGTQPTVAVRATNATGAVATIYGWMDYNANGVFDNATERTSVAIPNGIINGVFTLIFPTVPAGYLGTAYARFRLSTDAAAANSTGPAADGEVEDYRMTITGTSRAFVDSLESTKVASNFNGGPALANSDYFGRSVAAIGDLDGDGINDLAVGANGDDTGGTSRGAIHLLLMNSDGSVKTRQTIAGTDLLASANGNYFGSSVASLGDLDGDGVTDIAIGSERADYGGSNRGLVHIAFLNANGTVKASKVIASGANGGPALNNGDYFGRSVSALGDLDGDGITDLAVGAYGDDTGGANRGAVHVLYLNANGTVKSKLKIGSGLNGGPALSDSDYFGNSVASLGDVDGDGVTDIAVGAIYDDVGGINRGAVHVLFLNSNGTVKGSQKIASGVGGGPALANSDQFGASLAALGDLNGDGVVDLAVGANYDDTGGTNRGALHVLFLNANGTVRNARKLASGTGGAPGIANDDRFGVSVASLGDLNGDGRTDLAVGANFDDAGGINRGSVHILFLEGSVDFGDAPDSSAGTAPGNYRTVVSDNGPRHSVVAGLLLGASVDGDDGDLQNAAANSDDVNGALPDDEDGLTNPEASLVLTVGSQPLVTLRATNTTGAAATLYGWIDYNSDGVFDNAAERTSVAVASGTSNGLITLTLPTVPIGFTGSTYARFRLSTDAAASSSTGAAGDGEVEDYRVWIRNTSDGAADGSKTKKITSITNGGPTLGDGDDFGGAVAAIGDLDGDGVSDLAVAAAGDDTGGANRGAVHVLFMNADGTVKTKQKIASGLSGGLLLANGDYFGRSIAAVGDLDGDGVVDLAVGADGDDSGGVDRGAVHLLFMNLNGTVKSTAKIASGLAGGPSLNNSDYFGRSVTALGDMDGDGIADLAVGAVGDDAGGSNRGAVRVLFMNANGSVKGIQKIASSVGGGPLLADADAFGSSVTSLGDLDGDGVADLAVGAYLDDAGGNLGAVHILFMNSSGTVKSTQKIASGIGGGPTLNGGFFGWSVASMGDLDGDGRTDIGVGAIADGTGGTFRGAAYALLLNANGTVKGSQKIASGVGGGPSLSNYDLFGSALAAMGDLDGDGRTELAVGSVGDDTNGTGRGAAYVLFLRPFNTNPVITSTNTASVVENTTAVKMVTATDVDLPAQAITFSTVGGADQAKFAITSGGSLSFLTAPNFEIPTDANGDNVYVVTVRASDGNGGFADQTLNVSVTGVNDNNPVITSTNTASVVENTTAVKMVTATDVDLPAQAITFSTVGGADQAKFAITSGGSLSFLTAPNFEIPTDANGDNVYVVTVRASDGNGGFADQTLNVSVTGVNDNNPVFTSTNTANVAANTTSVKTVTATDADLPAQPVTFSIVGGADQAKFGITSGGSLSFNSAPNFEAPTDANGDNVYVVTVQASDGAGGTTTQTINVTVLPTPVDFGDAPDLGPGASAGNYNTLLSDNGPRHTVVTGLRIGTSIDGENSGALQNGTANADDVNGGLPDDEDGLTSPAADLVLTVGAQPTVTVRVTNTTASAATLHGWIDYNANGVFENAERASTSVSQGTSNGVVTLAFPAVPAGFTGATYARFRLSTSPAAAAPTGFAPDGEVEDYQVAVTRPSDGTVEAAKTRKIASGIGGGPSLSGNDYFGHAVASLGDLDGDGVGDLAVGAAGDDTGGNLRGAVYVMLMNPDGTAKSTQKIASGTGGGPVLADGDQFGISVSSLGDLDGDGVTDLAVGAFRDDTGGAFRGAVHVLFMNDNGTAKSTQKIASGIGGGPVLVNLDQFGSSVASLGDLNGDGVTDLAVGAFGDDTGGSSRGAIYVLFMNANGTAQSTQKIASGTGGGPVLSNNDDLGWSIASLGDLDGDGVTDLAIGARADDSGGADRGAMYVLFMNANGTAKVTQKIASGVGGGPSLGNNDRFGSSAAALGDLDGDGVADLGVGARYDDAGGLNRGALHVLFMNTDGTVKSTEKIASGIGGGPVLGDGDQFGTSVASLGDLDGDGRTDLAVGAIVDDAGGADRGAVHVLYSRQPNGDVDADTDVDGNDFLIWQRLFGSVSVPAGSGADTSRNGVVDGADLAIWRASFGESGSSAAAMTSVVTIAAAGYVGDLSRLQPAGLPSGRQIANAGSLARSLYEPAPLLESTSLRVRHDTFSAWARPVSLTAPLLVLRDRLVEMAATDAALTDLADRGLDELAEAFRGM